MAPCKYIHKNGKHVIYTNEAGSVHFTRYDCGCTSPMVGPDDEIVAEYQTGYLENKQERDRSYQEGLRFLREGPRRGFWSRLFSDD